MARWRFFFRPTNRSRDKDFRLVHAVHEYFMNDRFGLLAVIRRRAALDGRRNDRNAYEADAGKSSSIVRFGTIGS